MEGKGNFFILIAIVAFLSLTLAMLAGYVLFMGGSDAHNEQEDKHNKVITVPTDDELGILSLYEEKKPFNLKSDDLSKLSVILLKIELKYFIKVEGVKDPLAKIEKYRNKILQNIGTYFQGKTVVDISKPEAKKTAEKELLKQINQLLSENEKEELEFIYSIVFPEWLYQ